MRRLDTYTVLLILFIPANLIPAGTAFSQDDADGSAMLNQLVLNVYIDERGRALINGYIDDPRSLPFLNSSENVYEEDSRQLYATTSALTSKFRDNWTVNFGSMGSYDEYHVIIYLPASAKLSRVNCSSGLGYLVSMANESIISEVQGHNVTDPAINIDYILPIGEASRSETEIVTGTDAGFPYKAIALLMLLIIGSGILIILLKPRSIFKKPAEHAERGYEHPMAPNESEPGRLDLSTPAGQIDAASQALPLNEDAGLSPRMQEDSRYWISEEKREKAVDLTSGILAVMDTLTDKEQAVVKALLRRGGTMTQRDIRYETDISKSSLSGILTSLEKRKLITKQEKGRTNVIELSDRFLNIKGRS